MSRFAPVHLSAPLDKRVSQTMLRHANSCMRSGLLYQETKGAVQTVEMLRGSAAHTIYERATNLMIEQGEPMLPPELVKVIVNEVLAEVPLPIEEHDYLREQAYRWASEWTIDPMVVVACETLFVIEIDGWQVRCKIDFASLAAGGLVAHVKDYKTGKGAPPWEEISRKRTDGTISAKNIQLILYSLALVYGRPVRVERCWNCDGIGSLGLSHDEQQERGEARTECPICNGHGHVETIEPFPVAARAQEVIAEFIYPGIEDSEGKMLRRPMSLNRMELDEYRESLSAILAGLDHAEQTGDWPAVVSDAACNECPCSARCPIPAELRDHRGEINDYEELVEAATVYYRRKKELEADRREIKSAAKAYGEGPRARVRFGKDRVWEIGDLRESSEIPDKDGMFDAMQRAVDFGEPFERAAWVKPSKTTPFAERALSEDELAEEAAQAAINTEQEVNHAGQ